MTVIGKARARRSDPETSHLAAEQVTETRSASKQAEICLAAVRKWPGLTAAEIAKRTGLLRHTPSRRLPELRKEGLIKNNGRRVCGVTGNPSMTWAPVLAEPVQQNLF